MVSRSPGWGVVGRAYHKIQIVSCASAKLHVTMKFSARVKKYPKIV